MTTTELIATAPSTGSLTVVKRDGRSLAFDDSRIRAALHKAFEAAFGEVTNANANAIANLTSRIDSELAARFTNEVKIYEIQSVVEHVLLEAREYEAAHSYIDYRVQRDFARSKATDLNHSINKLLDKDAALVNENANKDSDVYNTQRDLTAGIVGKAIGLRMLPPHVANAHQKGDIHYHDLDYHPYQPMTNCCLIDFETMLATGFRIGNAAVTPPRSIQTATAQISQIIANVSSSQYGGCTVNRADELLAPYARLNFAKHLADADEWVEGEEKQREYALAKTRKDIYDAMQSLEYEINTLFTSNGQTPFTSVGFGLGTDWYEREIQRAILNIRIRGLGGEGRTAIFPKLLFTLKRGLNLSARRSQLRHQAARRGVRHQAHVPRRPELRQDRRTHRLLQGAHGLPLLPAGMGQTKTAMTSSQGRMNLGVVTLNLPRIALESRGSHETFWSLLEERLEIVHDALVYRVRRCKEAMPGNAPILYVHGAFGKRLDPLDAWTRSSRTGARRSRSVTSVSTRWPPPSTAASGRRTRRPRSSRSTC